MIKLNLKTKLENYSFCLFRIPETGGRVLWEITNSCNYSCSYCIFTAENGKVEGELNTEEVFKVLDGLKSRNFTHIKFTGGEPFIRKDMLNILGKTSDLGFIVDVSTNGSLINDNKAKMIKEYGIKMIHVSVDGHNQETHEIARGKNTYQRTIRGIQHLKNNDNYVRVGTVIFKANENYLEAVIQSAESMEVDEIIFSFMEPIGRMEGNDSIISNRPITEVKSELEELSDKYSGKINVNYSFTENTNNDEFGICPGGNRFLFIDNYGRVSPCTWIVDKNPEFRSKLTVKDVSFDEVMNSDPIVSYLSCKKILSYDGLKGCPTKRRC
ncbi:radical SAM/SPASM domain-containing protein [Nanoarchaeota archaeon]